MNKRQQKGSVEKGSKKELIKNYIRKVNINMHISYGPLCFET